MAGVVASSLAVVARSRWERYAPAMERIAAPFATGTGLVLGGTLLGSAVEGLRVSGPELLLFLGASAVAGGATLLASRRGAAPEEPEEEPRVRSDGTVVCSRCSTSVPAHEWSEIVRRAWHTASARPSLAVPASSVRPGGDGIWGRWVPEEVSRLPVALVGPVPETAWIPPVPGRIVPFPDREPQQIVLGGQLVPIVATVPEERFEPDLLRTAEILAPPELPSSFAPVPNFSAPGGFDYAFVPDASYDWLTAEALHPIPPHLRPGAHPAGPVRPLQPVSPAKPTPGARSCATCSRALPPSVRSRPCPDCRQPVCLTCRTQAVVNYGQTWCGTCASSHRWEDPPPAGRWAPEVGGAPNLPIDPSRPTAGS